MSYNWLDLSTHECTLSVQSCHPLKLHLFGWLWSPQSLLQLQTSLATFFDQFQKFQFCKIHLPWHWPEVSLHHFALVMKCMGTLLPNVPIHDNGCNTLTVFMMASHALWIEYVHLSLDCCASTCSWNWMH